MNQKDLYQTLCNHLSLQRRDLIEQYGIVDCLRAAEQVSLAHGTVKEWHELTSDDVAAYARHIELALA